MQYDKVSVFFRTKCIYFPQIRGKIPIHDVCDTYFAPLAKSQCGMLRFTQHDTGRLGKLPCYLLNSWSLCLYPLAKLYIPLGRKVCYKQILPRVYALITCMLCASVKGGISSSAPCYSNISSAPWHDGLWITDDRGGWVGNWVAFICDIYDFSCIFICLTATIRVDGRLHTRGWWRANARMVTIKHM